MAIYLEASDCNFRQTARVYAHRPSRHPDHKAIKHYVQRGKYEYFFKTTSSLTSNFP